MISERVSTASKWNEKLKRWIVNDMCPASGTIIQPIEYRGDYEVFNMKGLLSSCWRFQRPCPFCNRAIQNRSHARRIRSHRIPKLHLSLSFQPTYRSDFPELVVDPAWGDALRDMKEKGLISPLPASYQRLLQVIFK